jgi:hypothetical protein
LEHVHVLLRGVREGELGEILGTEGNGAELAD